MVDAQHVHNLIFNAVDNDVGQAREGQFAGAIDPPLAAAVRKSPQAATALVQRLRHLSGCTRIVFLNVPNNAIEVFGRSVLSGALRLQNLFQLGAHFVVLHEFPALCCRQADVHGLDETSIVF